MTLSDMADHVVELIGSPDTASTDHTHAKADVNGGGALGGYLVGLL